VTGGWSFWIDRGGTFTDIVAETPAGDMVVEKLLSENPERYDDAATHGIRLLMERYGEAGPAAIHEVKLGTTVATNALLERKGDATVLAITAGFADLLRIGYQARPRLFDRRIELPSQLYGRTVEIAERLGPDGGLLIPLDLAAAERDLTAAREAGFRSVAIVLMHAYRNPRHELALEALALKLGFEQVSTSHRVSALMKIVGRGDTTVVDAYLSPPLRRYVRGVASSLGPGAPLSFMQSNGGLAPAAAFRGRDAVLSGPAGGVVGMVEVARGAGFAKVIGFDMGGTSTDVSHYAGAYERVMDTTVAGVRLQTPMMSIHTVAAGGGSICRFDGARLRVGPQSAGANPGPACYRRGGPLTVTDCNVMLGKLRAEFFPPVLGPEGNLPIDPAVVETRFAEVADEVAAATGRRLTAQALAEGFLAIAVDNMAHAIKRVSVAKGYDLTEYALVSFGGAGGQHACLVAEALGMTTIVISPLAGVLSAYGIGRAEHRSLAHRAIERDLAEAGEAVAVAVAEAEAQLLADAAHHTGSGGAAGERRFERRVHLKHKGADTTIPVELTAFGDLEPAFQAAYAQRYSFTMPDAAIVVESVEVEMVEDQPRAGARRLAGAVAASAGGGAAEVWMDGVARPAQVLDRTGLAAGDEIAGPAIVFDGTGTTVVEPRWSAQVRKTGDLVLTRGGAAVRPAAASDVPDPVRLEVFANLYMAIAEQMGVALQSTAYSVNIKERLDFSCAIFDAAGALVANAPHMPVHLGSMGDSVRAVIVASEARGEPLRPGDVYALNNPYAGGTHLPDITVVMPLFDDGGGRRLCFLAARGHHADVGGLTPGSMPPMSHSIAEEGVLIDSVRIVRDGRFDEAVVRATMTAGPYPARNVGQNIGDLRAQVAACARGAGELRRAFAEHGEAVVMAYMRHVQANAAEAVRNLLSRLAGGAFRYEADDGWSVRVEIAVDREARTAVVDFTGTSGELTSNFNAPPSIVRAATLYVVRTLLDDDIPMNDGCLAPITIVNPAGSLLNPRPPAAVVAGNVETSQVVTDALYGATGALAAAQGTMNNFTFGNDRVQYYETICGGAGAGPDFDGADAVQTHMTNSRLTDPEVIEMRFPVLVEGFSIRRGSGGEGRWRGGDGVVRKVRFLEPMTASILANRRRVPPFGLEGGAPGALGRNYVLRADGSRLDLPACASVEVQAGDVFVIETPGGGGFGAPGSANGR
jgi:5-oxoprolinase (ATP-hydrolysing)